MERTAGTQSREWVKNAACNNTDTDLFFPVGESGLNEIHIQTAKEICRLCDVQADCLSYALNTKQEHGIWGGTTESERRKIFQRRRTNTA